MALNTAYEELSGGQVRDLDGRLIVTQVSDGGALPTQFAAISTAASGATSLVAAQAGQRVRVTSYVVVAAAAVTVKFQSGATDLTGAMSLAANGGLVVIGGAGNSLFETAVNTALNINLGGAVQVSGHLTYYLL